ncbi:MAG: preprotein translocase subunit SecE [Gammaproteobacteria bacterium]
METKTIEQSPWDLAKLGAALAILLGALVAFYYYADASKLYRVVGMLVAVGVAAVISLQTDKGRQVSGFVREAQVEVRKVVWPTRQETMQTTMFVMIVVVIFAILLWLLDLMLSSVIQMLIGRGA